MTLISHLRSVRAAWLLALLLAVTALLYLWTPSTPSITLDEVIVPPAVSVSEPTASPQSTKYAFVTFLAPQASDSDVETQDNYLTNIRMQAYALLHAQESRSDIPFIVMASKEVPEWKKRRLRADGATILDIEHIPLPSWLPQIGTEAWLTIFDKLAMWKDLAHLERVCFLDADVVVMGRLDGIFETAQAQMVDRTKAVALDHIDTLPDEYVLQATIELEIDHQTPPVQADWERGEYLNAGFLVLKPSLAVYEHYMAILSTPDSFKTEFAEQDLLNQIHRPDGPMPFGHLDWQYNVHRPTQGDIDARTKSVHSKWWNVHHHEILPFLQAWRWRMEGYFEFRDAHTLAKSAEAGTLAGEVH